MTDDHQLSSCFKQLIYKFKDISFSTANHYQEVNNKNDELVKSIGGEKIDGEVENEVFKKIDNKNFIDLKYREDSLEAFIATLPPEDQDLKEEYESYLAICKQLIAGKEQEKEEKNTKRIEAMSNFPSFMTLKNQKEKLKVLFKLKFDEKTITNLRKYVLVIDGSQVKLMERPNSKPALIDFNQVKNIIVKSVQPITASKKYNYLLQSLSKEIDNLFFKTI